MTLDEGLLGVSTTGNQGSPELRPVCQGGETGPLDTGKDGMPGPSIERVKLARVLSMKWHQKKKSAD